MGKVDSTTDLARLPSVQGSRNTFKYKKRVFTTYNVGEIVPIYHNMLIQPGDTIIMNMASLIRTPAQLFPCYDSLICEVFAFWRSHNDMYVHFNEVMGENKTGIWIAQQEYSLPQVVIPSGTKLDAHDILAHLGFPIQAGGYSGSKIGLDLYHYICNEYFNNNTVMPPIMWSDGDENITYNGSSLTGGTLRKACKLPDYFNTGVPEPLRAQEVNIPLVAQPVIGNGTSLGITDGNSNFSTIYSNNGSVYGLRLSTEVPPQTLPKNSNTYQASDQSKLMGISTDPTMSGLITDIEGSAIALNSLRIALSQQHVYEADAYYGVRAREIIKSRWQVETSTDVLHIPELIGHMKFALDTYQVTQTSETTASSPLGELGAYSQTGNSGHLFTKSFDYWGSLMIVAVVRQEQHTYAQGLPNQYSKQRRFDFYWPELAHLGFTATYNKEIYMTGNETKDNGVFNYRPIYQEYRFEPDMVNGEFNPSYEQSLDYQLLVDDYDNEDGTVGNAPVFSAEWVVETPDNVDRNLTFTHTEVNQIHMANKFDITKISKTAQYGYPGLTRF